VTESNENSSIVEGGLKGRSREFVLESHSPLPPYSPQVEEEEEVTSSLVRARKVLAKKNMSLRVFSPLAGRELASADV